MNTQTIRARLIFSIIIAVLALAFTAWCFIDGAFYLGLIGFLVLDIVLLEYITIKKKKKKTFALILNIIVADVPNTEDSWAVPITPNANSRKNYKQDKCIICYLPLNPLSSKISDKMP